MSVLAVVPARLQAPVDGELLMRCLVTLWRTAPEARVVVVDDASPLTDLAGQLGLVCAEVGAELIRFDEERGHAAAVNAGLHRALAAGDDALIVAPEVQFLSEDWLPLLLGRTDSEDRPAAVAGGRLLYPTGLIAHAGAFYSPLHGWFDNRFRFAPEDLPEALVPAVCPVGGELQLIRHATLERLGGYEEHVGTGRPDLDYCLRVFAAGLECVYEPGAWALHQQPDVHAAQDEAFHVRGVVAAAGLIARHGEDAVLAHSRKVLA
jgi:GT2 family glycosyltransferase